MQSGRARSQEWLLGFEPHGREIPDSLMGGPVEPSVLHSADEFRHGTNRVAFVERNGFRVEIRRL